MPNARRGSRRSPRATAIQVRVPVSRLRGKGDYSAEIISDPVLHSRLEKKIDHLEKQLSKSGPAKGASLVGRSLGNLVGQGDLGALAGEGLAKLIGIGDYAMSVKGNSLMAGVGDTVVPKFSGDGKRGVRLQEREFLGNVLAGATLVSGSTTFNNQMYVLNPTDPSTFPWLSKIASLFDQWEPHGIVFEFHTTSSTFNGSSQALGAVVMATDYDPLSAGYASKQEAENADYSCSVVPSSNLLHGIECDPRERPLPVLYTTQRATNPQFSSLGNFQISTQGCSVAGVTLGELWVSYDITFYKKQLVDNTFAVPMWESTGFQSPAGAQMVPPNPTVQKNGITIQPIVGTGTDVFLPPAMGTGTFLSTFFSDNFQTGDGASMTPVGTNCTVTYVNVPSPSGTVGAAAVFQALIKITAPGAKLRYGLKNSSGSVNTFQLLQVDPSTVIAL